MIGRGIFIAGQVVTLLATRTLFQLKAVYSAQFSFGVFVGSLSVATTTRMSSARMINSS